VFAKTFETGIAFNFGFGLPQLSRGTWNIAPAVNFVNSDGSDTEGAGEKIKLLSINMDGVGYNFEQYKYLRQQGLNPKWYAGITSSTWGYRLTSDLAPNASFSARYSLFSGDVRSDTARFSPFFEGMDATFSINRRSSIFAALNRVFCGAVKNETPALGTANQPSGDREAQRIADNPMFGSNSRSSDLPIPNTAGGWNASFTFSSSRSRPVKGATVIDPRAACDNLVDPRSRELCLVEAATLQPDVLQQTSSSRNLYVSPPRANLNANTSFNLTQKWSAQWTTDYDVEAKRFNSQIVSLRRELHDWDLVFGFNKTPYGAFSFTAFISLRAEPDLKFDYRKADSGRY
jgi:hypothetical protein